MVSDVGALAPVVIAGGIGLFLLAAGVREGYRAVGLWRRRPVPVGALADASGVVTVVGRAERLEATTRAPLTGTDCLAYAWRVLGLETVRRFDSSVERSFHQLGRGREAVPFRLVDESGSVVVDARGASLRLAEEDVPDPVSDPVERRDLSRAVGVDGPRQYVEGRVDEGETVVVQGTVQADEGTGLDADRVGVRLSGRGLYVSDTTRSNAIRRAAGAGAVSVALGLAALAVAVVIGGAVGV